MKQIKCLIVDDEELARNLLENYVQRLPHLELVAKCENPIKAMAVLLANDIDLLFLDIQMPELTGVEFLKTLNKKPCVVFTTAYPSYALEGYQLDITDYLLKPFSFERFMRAVQKATDLIKLKSLASNADGASDNKNYIVVNSEHKLIKLEYTDIKFIEGMREYAAYNTNTKGKILSLISLKKLEETLPQNKFLRVHKSYIVNTQKVTAIEGNFLYIGKEKLPIGASYKEHVLQNLF